MSALEAALFTQAESLGLDPIEIANSAVRVAILATRPAPTSDNPNDQGAYDHELADAAIKLFPERVASAVSAVAQDVFRELVEREKTSLGEEGKLTVWEIHLERKRDRRETILRHAGVCPKKVLAIALARLRHSTFHSMMLKSDEQLRAEAADILDNPPNDPNRVMLLAIIRQAQRTAFGWLGSLIAKPHA